MSNDTTESRGRKSADRRIIEDAIDVASCSWSAFDLETAPNAVIDQVAVGESHVGLESEDAGFFEPVAKGRRVAGDLEVRADHRFTLHRRSGGRLFPEGGAEPARSRRVAFQNVEMRNLPVVLNEKGLAGVQSPVDHDDGPTGCDAVRGLDDEAAGHRGDCTNR
jgi:hypothetical protein